MSNEGFNFSKFVDDSKNALLKPKEYFASMPVSGGFGEPIIKALIYGLLAGILTFIWAKLNIGEMDAGMLGKWLGNAVGVMSLVWSLIGALIGLFIGGAIMLVISAICGGSTDYEANVRVVASLMVISPVKALFGFLGFMSALGSIVGLLISLYSIWMLYHALNGSLKTKEASAKVLSIIFAVIIAISAIVGMGAKKAASGFMDSYGDKKMEEIVNDMEVTMEDATEAMEEVMNDMVDEVEDATDKMQEAVEEMTDELEAVEEEAPEEEVK